jgi:hypothetical protein
MGLSTVKRVQLSQRVPQAAPTGGRATAAWDLTHLGLTPLGQTLNNSLSIIIYNRLIEDY